MGRTCPVVPGEVPIQDTADLKRGLGDRRRRVTPGSSSFVASDRGGRDDDGEGRGRSLVCKVHRSHCRRRPRYRDRRLFGRRRQRLQHGVRRPRPSPRRRYPWAPTLHQGLRDSPYRRARDDSYGTRCVLGTPEYAQYEGAPSPSGPAGQLQGRERDLQVSIVGTIDDVGSKSSQDATARRSRKLSGDVKADVGAVLRHRSSRGRLHPCAVRSSGAVTFRSGCSIVPLNPDFEARATTDLALLGTSRKVPSASSPCRCRVAGSRE